MRPRPEGRGEPRTVTRPTVSRRCFNAATTRRPWRTTMTAARPRPAVASMRPRPEGRGEPHGRVAERRPASMRPRPEGRGERQTAATLVCMAASMRPRPEGRGEPASSDGRAAVSGFNAATTRRPWRTEPTPSALAQTLTWLQCGHDPKAVENDDQPAAARAVTGFNAATTRRPWRTL